MANDKDLALHQRFLAQEQTLMAGESGWDIVPDAGEPVTFRMR